jgi:hypothetical protein
VKIPKSSVAAVFAAIYLIAATYVTQDEVRHSHGGWINLRGFGTQLITAPSQILAAPLLEFFGVPPVNYAQLGLVDYSQLVLHVLLSAATVYLVVAALHIFARKSG